MNIYEILKDTGLPVAYGRFKEAESPPFIVYTGDGQSFKASDNTYSWRKNTYQIEYYFDVKDEDNEAAIENALLDASLPYSKSSDSYISSEDLFVIYYITG